LLEPDLKPEIPKSLRKLFMECPDDLDDMWLNCRELPYRDESVSAENRSVKKLLKMSVSDEDSPIVRP